MACSMLLCSPGGAWMHRRCKPDWTRFSAPRPLYRKAGSCGSSQYANRVNPVHPSCAGLLNVPSPSMGEGMGGGESMREGTRSVVGRSKHVNEQAPIVHLSAVCA